MLSKKYFLAGGRSFSAPPARPARAKVRDHIESQEGDHRASYMSCRGSQQRKQLKTDFREILRAAQFSTFSTASTHHRHPFGFAERKLVALQQPVSRERPNSPKFDEKYASIIEPEDVSHCHGRDRRYDHQSRKGKIGVSKPVPRWLVQLYQSLLGTGPGDESHADEKKERERIVQEGDVVTSTVRAVFWSLHVNERDRHQAARCAPVFL
jgi:hypothetical protein